MRFPHTLTFTRDDGTTYTVSGYAEAVAGTSLDSTGARSKPSIEALCNATGFGDTWTVAEGDRMTGPYGITGIVTQVRPVMSADTGRLHHVEMTAG